jgi:hypothetical protein
MSKTEQIVSVFAGTSLRLRKIKRGLAIAEDSLGRFRIHRARTKSYGGVECHLIAIKPTLEEAEKFCRIEHLFI